MITVHKQISISITKAKFGFLFSVTIGGSAAKLI